MLLFTHLLMLYTKMLQAKSLEEFEYAWDAPVWLLFTCLISIGFTKLVKNKIPQKWRRSQNHLSILFLSTLLFIGVSNVLVLLFENVILSKSLNYNSLLVNNLLFLIVHLVISNTYLVYYYLRALHQTQLALLKTQKMAGEHQLEQLKQQISPHFLFNNLNVLSSLIHTDTQVADIFLDKFSSLYRYTLQSREQNLVPLSQELDFIINYMFLIEQRFEHSYQLKVPDTLENHQYLIIPNTLQQLVENVIKHNQASPDHPLLIDLQIDFSEEIITIENKLRPKKYKVPSTQTGLKNIQEQYHLLTQKSIKIKNTSEEFAVSIPLLKIIQSP